MEALIDSENLAIVALSAWVISLKLDVKYYRERLLYSWQLVEKTTLAIRHIQEVLKITLDDEDSV